MNVQEHTNPKFPYDKEHVRVEYRQEEDIHVVYIFILDHLVNRKLFFSVQEAANHHHDLELALQLGATFNDKGYWSFEVPFPMKKELQDKYYRLSKG